MDGYAVIADDPSPWREIVGHQTAGYVGDVELHLGTAAWITTGAPVPAGADAVVPVEATELSDGHVVIVDELIRQGDNIRPIGVDLAAGTVVLNSGRRLGPAEIGLLAGLGDRSGAGYPSAACEHPFDRKRAGRARSEPWTRSDPRLESLQSDRGGSGGRGRSRLGWARSG